MRKGLMNMRKGKYLKPRAKKNGTVILIISLVLLLAIAVGGTVAYLRATSGSLTNTFTLGEVKIIPTEKTTENTKSDIQFKNDGTVPVYVRATLVIYWTDIINGSEQAIAPPASSAVSIGAVKDGWFQVGDIYYYSVPVTARASTTVMLDTITVTLPNGSTAQCHIDVHAEAIQATPASVVEDAWADVTISDGKLVAVTPAEG